MDTLEFYATGTEEFVNELVGETMTFENGSITMTLALFAGNGYAQEGDDPVLTGDIVSIDKLTAF